MSFEKLEKKKDLIDRMSVSEVLERLRSIHPALAEEFPKDDVHTIKTIYRTIIEHGRRKIEKLKDKKGVYNLDEIIRSDLKNNKIIFKGLPVVFQERIVNAVRNSERKTPPR